jgi:hypothetical protein
MLGHHASGSCGTLLVVGIHVSAMALRGLSVPLTGARRTWIRGRTR